MEQEEYISVLLMGRLKEPIKDITTMTSKVDADRPVVHNDGFDRPSDNFALFPLLITLLFYKLLYSAVVYDVTMVLQWLWRCFESVTRAVRP